MKKVYSDKILNIGWTDKFDNRFLFEYFFPDFKNAWVEVIYMSVHPIFRILSEYTFFIF